MSDEKSSAVSLCTVAEQLFQVTEYVSLLALRHRVLHSVQNVSQLKSSLLFSSIFDTRNKFRMVGKWQLHKSQVLTLSLDNVSQKLSNQNECHVWTIVHVYLIVAHPVKNKYSKGSIGLDVLPQEKNSMKEMTLNFSVFELQKGEIQLHIDCIHYKISTSWIFIPKAISCLQVQNAASAHEKTLVLILMYKSQRCSINARSNINKCQACPWLSYYANMGFAALFLTLVTVIPHRAPPTSKVPFRLLIKTSTISNQSLGKHVFKNPL